MASNETALCPLSPDPVLSGLKRFLLGVKPCSDLLEIVGCFHAHTKSFIKNEFYAFLWAQGNISEQGFTIHINPWNSLQKHLYRHTDLRLAFIFHIKLVWHHWLAQTC